VWTNSGGFDAVATLKSVSEAASGDYVAANIRRQAEGKLKPDVPEFLIYGEPYLTYRCTFASSNHDFTKLQFRIPKDGNGWIYVSNDDLYWRRWHQITTRDNK
jgi:hypothetical protein